MFREAGGVKRAAAFLGKSANLLYKFADHAHKHEISFSAVCRLVEAGNTIAVDYLATLAGGAFMPGEASDDDMGAVAARAAVAHGGFLAAVITRERPEKTLIELDQLVKAAMQARAKLICEMGRGV